MYADVYVSSPVSGLFTYRIPEGIKVNKGSRIWVNFSNRKIVAFVIRLHGNKPAGFDVKDLTSVIDSVPVFDKNLIDLAEQTAAYYLSTPGEVLAMALPGGLKFPKRLKTENTPPVQRDKQLNESQQLILNDIINSYKSGKNYHLMFGVTGCGKTEVYIKIAEYLIQRGRSVIYLVPEISVSSQIFQRLYEVFGNELVIYHSGISANERFLNWMKFYTGEAKIVVGARSAVFMQCPQLGSIIIDEEHDGSYKENSSPRYNARRIAAFRSQIEDSLLILGSATPSVESLYATEKGVIMLHTFKSRYGDKDLPVINVVKIDPNRVKDLISPILRLHTKKVIDEGDQVIYLLNRRGFAPFVLCSECGSSVECPQCSISLNYHSSGDLRCHYCSYSRKIPDSCKTCSSSKIIKIGFGTQRIEEMLKKSYRDFRIFRLDRDSSRKKNMAFELLDMMKNREVDILLGTQMVAKGFDFPHVTLVGVLLADIGLNIPDFRASERIFSLLIQVAGRSGRGDKPGMVIIQTINDDLELYKYLENHDYYGFYRSELEVRKNLNYPPFTRLARLLVRGEDEESVAESIKVLKDKIDSNIKRFNDGDISVLGPCAAPISKISKNFRYHLIIKSKNISDLIELIKESRSAVTQKRTYLEIDIDPEDLL